MIIFFEVQVKQIKLHNLKRNKQKVFHHFMKLKTKKIGLVRDAKSPALSVFLFLVYLTVYLKLFMVKIVGKWSICSITHYRVNFQVFFFFFFCKNNLASLLS